MQAMNEHLLLFIEFTQFSLSELLLHAECTVGYLLPFSLVGSTGYFEKMKKRGAILTVQAYAKGMRSRLGNFNHS